MAVDLFLVTGDSGVEFLRDPLRISNDVRAIHQSMYEFHTFLGMHTMGASKVAWVARKHGYSSQVLGKIQMLPFRKMIEYSEPFINEKTLIGLSTSLVTHPEGDYSQEHFRQSLSSDSVASKMYRFCEYYRKKYNSKIIVGGTHASAFADYFKADHVIQGEAENKLPQLLDKLKRSGIQKKPYDWSITSCDFKWHDTDFIVSREVLPLETSRGCIFKCDFCQFDDLGKKIGTYERSLDHIRDQLIENYEKYKTTHYWLTDDTFNDNNGRVLEFCEMAESLPFKPSFMGYIRLDLAHKFQETTRRLYKAGLVACSIGIESFHPEAAAAVSKPFSAKYGKQFLDHFYHDICESNIVINCCNIIGLPGETEEHVRQTMDWYQQRPYIHTNWSALYINDPKRLPPEQATSVFEREAEKHGYKFFDDQPRHYWERGDFNAWKAKELKRRVVSEMKIQNIKTGEPWTSMHFLSLLNLTPKQARDMGWYNIYVQHTKNVQQHNLLYFKKYRQHIKDLGLTVQTS